MDRRSTKCSWKQAFPLAVVMLLLVAAGCHSAIATGMWLWNGPMIPADNQELLEDKKVAVVCRNLSSREVFTNGDVHQRLARALRAKLGANVDDIEIVDGGKVEDWLDHNQYNDFSEVGRAVKADMVLGVDIEDFTTQAAQSTTLHQGAAIIRFEVYDCEKNKPVLSESLPTKLYPDTGVPASEMARADFTNRYVDHLAHEIGKYFYPRDRHEEFAGDDKAYHAG